MSGKGCAKLGTVKSWELRAANLGREEGKIYARWVGAGKEVGLRSAIPYGHTVQIIEHTIGKSKA